MIPRFDAHAVRRAFSRAAPRYSRMANLQGEVEAELLEQLELEPAGFAPDVVLDVGSGPGIASAALRRRFPAARVLALDQALAMLREVRRNARWWRRPSPLAADARALPLRESSVDLIFSSLCLQWLGELPPVFDEWRRVLRPGGVVLASTFGRDTLMELRDAFALADPGSPHVNAFDDIARIGDALVAAGFCDPVLQREIRVAEYSQVMTLMRELRNLGAGNAMSHRRRGLTGKQMLRDMTAAYEPLRREGFLPATWEIITLRAFAPPAGAPRSEGGARIASVPLEQIPIRRRTR